MSFDLLLAVLAVNFHFLYVLTWAGEYIDFCSESFGSDISYYRGGCCFLCVADVLLIFPRIICLLS